MRLLWLPDKLRAWGLDVVEVPGWRGRGSELPGTPRVVIGHHTATSARARGDLPTLAILRDGRADLPGPLCQIGLGRSGTAYVIAAGKANHAGRGRWGSTADSGATVGIEVEHSGSGPWNPEQLDAFDRVAAALLDGLGLTADRYCGHREWALPAGRKGDPGGVDLDAQRRRVHQLLARPYRAQPAQQEDDDVTPQDIEKIAQRTALLITGGARVRDGDGQIIDSNGAPISTADLYGRLERVEAKLDQVLAAR